MIRYPAFDPPEYADWKPDPQVLHEYRQTIETNEEKREIVLALEPPELISMYEGLVRNRLHDIMLKRWVKQGVTSKAWLGTGEEAAARRPMDSTWISSLP
jgi:TPP-dependent pyruvate/acetoin dehydrogenase alpha subunit